VPFPESDADDLPPAASAWGKPCVPREHPGKNIPASQCKEVKGILDKCGVLWPPRENRVTGNVVSGSGVADLAVGTLDVFDTGVTTQTLGNCFSGNTFGSSAPQGIEQVAPCAGSGNGRWNDAPLDLVGVFLDIPAAPPTDAWKTTPRPGAQPTMPGGVTAKATRFTAPRKPDLAAIEVPPAPAS
jgi:hypothetical protein